MVLADTKIREMFAKIDGSYQTLDMNLLNPSSIDVTLGDLVKEPMWYWKNSITRIFAHYLGNKRYFSESRKFSTFTLWNNQFALFHTREFIEVPIDKCASIFMKSSLGRMGLEHNHSAWIDTGFKGQITLELTNDAPFPIKLRAGQRIAQIVFFDIDGIVVHDYSQTGHYQNQTGATPSRGLSQENYDKTQDTCL